MQSLDARDYALTFHAPVALDVANELVRGNAVHFRDCLPGMPGVHLQVESSSAYLHVASGAVADFKARLARPGAAPAPVEGAEPYVSDWLRTGRPDAFRYGLRLSEAVRSAPEAVRRTVLANATLAVLRAADAVA